MGGKKQSKQDRLKEMIRAEIQRLDQKTGLKGSAVTVRLYVEPEPIGCFTFIDPVRMTFGFSRTRLEEPGFTETELLAIVRHEYAHYMEYVQYGESTDHGENWKACCRRIGARPEVLYTEQFKASARQHQKELVRRTRVDGYTRGKLVHHPVFGTGTVEEITRFPTMTILSVRFENETKKLDINWVRENCTPESQEGKNNDLSG